MKTTDEFGTPMRCSGIRHKETTATPFRGPSSTQQQRNCWDYLGRDMTRYGCFSPCGESGISCMVSWELACTFKMLMQILEIGCGNGVFTRRLVELEASKHIVASDFSENQLSHARFRTQSAVKQGNETEPPLVEFRNVDAVEVDGAFLPHSQEWAQKISEVGSGEKGTGQVYAVPFLCRDQGPWRACL